MLSQTPPPDAQARERARLAALALDGDAAALADLDAIDRDRAAAARRAELAALADAHHAEAAAVARAVDRAAALAELEAWLARLDHEYADAAAPIQEDPARATDAQCQAFVVLARQRYALAADLRDLTHDLRFVRSLEIRAVLGDRRARAYTNPGQGMAPVPTPWLPILARARRDDDA